MVVEGGGLEVHGGMKVYRGSAAAARNYVETDRSRVDDYYLAEGMGLVDRYFATPDNVRVAGWMDGSTYERWVAGFDVETGNAKGRLRTDDQAVRFVEVVVNGPKTWSLAAALQPGLAIAHDAAQERAARQIIARRRTPPVGRVYGATAPISGRRTPPSERRRTSSATDRGLL